MSDVVAFPVAPRRSATVSALLCGDDLAKHLQRSVLAYMAAYGSQATILEVDRLLIRAGLDRDVSKCVSEVRE